MVKTSNIPDSHFRQFAIGCKHRIGTEYIKNVYRNGYGEVTNLHSPSVFFNTTSDNRESFSFYYDGDDGYTFEEICKMYEEMYPTLESKIESVLKRKNKKIKEITHKYDEEIKMICRGL